MLVIRPAQTCEYQRVRLFYHAVIRGLKDAEYSPGWQIDIYPSPDFLRESIQNGELYVGEWNSAIISAMVINQQSNEGYEKIAWPSRASVKQVMVLHALGVHPAYAGRGVGRQMVQKAVCLAREAGMRALRLDVLSGNVPAEKLYESLGFQKVQTVSMYYPDTGWTDYEGYELIL
jgi:ribosomal protein S18 acetylase RimI-like enzyme